MSWSTTGTFWGWGAVPATGQKGATLIGLRTETCREEAGQTGAGCAGAQPGLSAPKPRQSSEGSKKGYDLTALRQEKSPRKIPHKIKMGTANVFQV